MANNAAFDLFVERAHQLLQAGYEMLDAKACNLWAEPEISGELGSKIEEPALRATAVVDAVLDGSG